MCLCCQVGSKRHPAIVAFFPLLLFLLSVLWCQMNVVCLVFASFSFRQSSVVFVFVVC